MILRIYPLNANTTSIEEVWGGKILDTLYTQPKHVIHLGKHKYYVQCFRTDAYGAGDKNFGKLEKQGNLWGRNNVGRARVKEPKIPEGFYISALDLYSFERQQFFDDVEKYLR